MSPLWLQLFELIVLGTSAMLVGATWLLRVPSRGHVKLLSVSYGIAALFFLTYGARVILFGNDVYLGAHRKAYLAFLIAHVVTSLGAFLLGGWGVLRLVRAVRGSDEDYDRHDRIARVLDPVWLIACVSGVIAYAIRLWSAEA